MNQIWSSLSLVLFELSFAGTPWWSLGGLLCSFGVRDDTQQDNNGHLPRCLEAATVQIIFWQKTNIINLPTIKLAWFQFKSHPIWITLYRPIQFSNSFISPAVQSIYFFSDRQNEISCNFLHSLCHRRSCPKWVSLHSVRALDLILVYLRLFVLGPWKPHATEEMRQRVEPCVNVTVTP